MVKMMNNLVIDQISFSYSEEKILDNITFSLNNDDFLAVLGKSGSGKTTLLKIISGLLFPSNGEVYLNNENLNKLPAYKRKISMIFQENHLYNNLTIYQNLLLGFKKQRIKDEEKDLIIKDVIKKLKITKFLNLKPKHLSLGEQQKIALAKNILSNDNLYLFDEPFSSLDVKNKEMLLSLLIEIKKEKKCPFIYVCHEANDAYKLANKILILKDGKILQFGNINEVINKPKYLEVRDYIGDKLNVFNVFISNGKIKFDNDIIYNNNLKISGLFLLGISYKNFYLDENGDFKGIIIKKIFSSDLEETIYVKYDNNVIIIPLKKNENPELNQEIHFSFILDDYFIFDRFTHLNYFFNL